MLSIDIPHRNIGEQTCLVRHATIAFCGSLKEKATVLDFQSAHSFGRPPRHVANAICMRNPFREIGEGRLGSLQRLRLDLNLRVRHRMEFHPFLIGKVFPFILGQEF